MIDDQNGILVIDKSERQFSMIDKSKRHHLEQKLWNAVMGLQLLNQDCVVANVPL